MKLAIESTKLADGSTSKMLYKLIPQEDHHRNLCKRSIRTFKDHFIGVLSGCAKKMPMHLWYQLLPQVERQLLLLQQLQVNPGIWYTQMCTKTAITTASIILLESLVHVKPRKTTNICTTLQQGICHWHIIQALPVQKNGRKTRIARVYQEQSGSNTNTWPPCLLPQKIKSLQQLVD